MRNQIVLPALPPLTDDRVDAEVESVVSEQQSEENSISQASNHYVSRWYRADVELRKYNDFCMFYFWFFIAF